MKKIIAYILFILSIQITCYGAAATMYVTPGGALAKDGSNWANAMGYAEWEADVEASAEAGDIYYVAGGTYTLTSDFATALDGTAVAPIKIIGVKSGTTNEPPVFADWATGTDRPLITDGASAYAFQIDDYWQVQNLRMTGSDTDCFLIGSNTVMENCYASNDGAATRAALHTDANFAKFINCEGVSTNGRALYFAATIGVGYGNYLHDSVTGITSDGNYNIFMGNFIDTVTYGLTIPNSVVNNRIIGNTIYSGSGKGAGSRGLNIGTGSSGMVVINNIITDFETGIYTADASPLSGFFDYNDIYDCTTDRTAESVPVGNHDIDVDPAFGNAANGDFSVTAIGVLGQGLMGTDGS